MPIPEILWPEERVDHIGQHGVRPEEFEEVAKATGPNPVYDVLGETDAGRALFCVVIEFPGGRGYPVTNPLAPSLAESWTVSADGLAYEFVLRQGARFHNGDPVTAEDVKFSFERYRGTAHKTFTERVAAVEILGPTRVRFRLKAPWPDFLTFYSSATGAGWIVPKKYVEKGR